MFSTYASRFLQQRSSNTAPLFHSSNSGGDSQDSAMRPLKAHATSLDEMDEDDEGDCGPPDEIAIEITDARTVRQGVHNAQDITGLGDDEIFHRMVDPKAAVREIAATDRIWATFYLGSVALLLATTFTIWLTQNTASILPGDSVGLVLKASTWRLAKDTTIAIVISLLYLVCMHFVLKPVFYVLLVAFPIIFFALGIYTASMSYRGRWGGATLQDSTMRWFAFVPACTSVLWVIITWRNRLKLKSAVCILEVANMILLANATVMPVSVFISLISLTLTWAWIACAGVIFMAPLPWLLGIFYALVLLWSSAMLSSFRRAIVSIVVSQWYFYRHNTTGIRSTDTVASSCRLACYKFFGTVCYSSLLVLLVRLPTFLIPSRIAKVTQLLYIPYLFSSRASLSDPLTLTFAAIHLRPLRSSAQTLRTPALARALSLRAWQAYRLAKLLLLSGRLLTSMVLGIATWVNSTRGSSGGSLYGYVVGLLAAFIGYAALGSTEGCISQIIDAALVCDLVDSQEHSHFQACRDAYRL